MRANKKRNIYSAVGLTFCFGILLITIGCKDTTATVSTVSTQKLTQAILKTQDFSFDINDINKVEADYKPTLKLEVPKDLVGQNKWIMFEGPVLENDIIAYRYYADARHRYDIYGKSVDDLVMDTVSWQYHDLMDWGSDILKVGNSLGIGSPAVYYKDSVYTLSNWDRKTIEVTENGNAKSSILTTFYGLDVDGVKFDLTESWSLAAGTPWCDIALTVINGQLPEGAKFVTGIVKHLEESVTASKGEYTYCYTYGQQSFHNQNLGMAIMIPNLFTPRQVINPLSHLLIIDGNISVNYKFMASWAEGINGHKTKEAFEAFVIKSTNI